MVWRWQCARPSRYRRSTCSMSASNAFALARKVEVESGSASTSASATSLTISAYRVGASQACGSTESPFSVSPGGGGRVSSPARRSTVSPSAPDNASSRAGWNPPPRYSTTSADWMRATPSGVSSRSCGSAPGGEVEDLHRLASDSTGGFLDRVERRHHRHRSGGVRVVVRGARCQDQREDGGRCQQPQVTPGQERISLYPE